MTTVLGGVRLSQSGLGIGERLHQLRLAGHSHDRRQVRDLVLTRRLLPMRVRHGPKL